MPTPKITAHMIVKNDDIWVWFAIQSIIKYVDKFLIYDTGSSDNTIRVIKSINSPKIVFKTFIVDNSKKLVSLRRQQLKQTKTPWLWMIDADEVYPKITCLEIVSAIKNSSKLEGIIVKRFDLLGDVFHYQPDEKVGGYNLFGKTAHHSLRLVRTTIPALDITGTYPNETFINSQKKPLITHAKKNFFFTKNRYLHTTYLKRSSIGKNLSTTLHRHKYKIEWGQKLSLLQAPKVFFKPRPNLVPDPLIKRSLDYNLTAAIITPIKVLKRKLFK